MPLLLALDLSASYGENADGVKTKQLFSVDGKSNFGPRLWETGRRAIAVLEDALEDKPAYLGPHQLAESLPAFVRSGEKFLEESLLPCFRDLIANGGVEFQCEDGKPCDFEGIWATSEFTAKVEIFCTYIGAAPITLQPAPDIIPIVQRLAAAAVLILLDEALIAEFLDSDSLDDVVSSIEKLRPHLEPPKNAFAMIEAARLQATEEVVNSRKMKLSQAGENGARRKHAKTDALKAWAENEAKTMRGDQKGIARKLAMRIPNHLVEVSRDPERLIYDHLRKQNRSG